MERRGGIAISIIRGTIVDGSPMVRAKVTGNGRLRIGQGPLRICVDTGFNGDVALPTAVLKRLKLEYVGRVDYRLATGRVETLKQWLGMVEVSGQRYECFFLKGDWLLGMDFIQQVFRHANEPGHKESRTDGAALIIVIILVP